MLFSKSVSLFLPGINDGDFLPSEVPVLCSCCWPYRRLLSRLSVNPVLPSSSLTPSPSPPHAMGVPISTRAPAWVGCVHMWDGASPSASGQDSILKVLYLDFDKDLKD